MSPSLIAWYVLGAQLIFIKQVAVFSTNIGPVQVDALWEHVGFHLDVPLGLVTLPF